MKRTLAELFALGDVPSAVAQQFASAEEIYSEAEVGAAVDRIAVALTVALQDMNPVVIAIMQGGLYFTGMLMQRMVFPIQQGYVHVSRYGEETTGGELVWKASSHPPLGDRHVLLVDDILDHGVTLRALHDWALQENVSSVTSAVLVRKLVQEQAIEADYCALQCEDRFLFGCGMDFSEYGRNLPSIYALPG